MKTIEDKAKAYADRVDDEYRYDPFSEVHLERMVDECRKAFVIGYQEAMRDVRARKKRKRDGNQYAYRKGATEALAGQWRSGNNPPKHNHIVFVLSDADEPELCYTTAHYQDGVWRFPDDWYYGCKVLKWMEPPKDESE